MNEERSNNTQDIGESSYRQYLDGDKDKFKVLVEYYGANLIYFINGYVKNIFVAEDLMEETFCDLVYYKHRYKGKSSFKTYLFSIARNKAVDYLKSKERNVEFGHKDTTRSWQPHVTITLADNTISNNYFENNRNFQANIYLDNGSTNIEVANNVIDNSDNVIKLMNELSIIDLKLFLPNQYYK